MNLKTAQNHKEVEDAYTIRRIVFIEEQNVPVEEEMDQYDDEAVHFVLYLDDTPIGAGRFRIVDGFGKIERICVLKEYRKSGAGRTIMLGMEDYAIQQGTKMLKLNSQTHAIPFYAGLGYEVVSEEFMDAGIPHRTMTKHI